jgi:hypothetical protein
VTLDPVAIADFLQRAGVVGLLVFILVGGARKIWVWGYQLVEMQADRDRWRDLALNLLGQTKRATDVVERSVAMAEKKAVD